MKKTTQTLSQIIATNDGILIPTNLEKVQGGTVGLSKSRPFKFRISVYGACRKCSNKNNLFNDAV